MYEYQ